MRIKQLAIAASIAAVMAPAVASDLFTVTGEVGGVTQSYSFSTALDTIDAAEFNEIKARFPAYTGNEAASLSINYRGLSMGVSFPAGSNTLTFTVLGETRTFTGATRDAAQDAFGDYMEKDGGELLNRIVKRLAEVSPSDPIAGNPNSLQGQMVANDFATGFNSVASNIAPSQAQQQQGDKVNNLVGVGARFSSLSQNGAKNNNFTIPFSYTIRSDIDPRRQLIFNIPISYTEVEGAKAYTAGFGAAYRQPVNDNWTLTPALNYGVTGSIDLGSVGHAVTASLASTYILNLNGFDLAIGNMVGYFTTLKVTSDDFSYDPDISNTVLRNGLMLSQPVSLAGKKMSIEYSVIDTRFSGSALYNKSYDEVGITLGTNKSANTARSFFRAGASYLHAKGSKGFTLNLGYWF